MPAHESGVDPLPHGPPQPIPIGPAPTWVTMLGALFGGLTLLGLFLFTYISGQNPDFICNAFTLLAAVFALGAALAGGFIGGAAAITGNLGTSAKNNAIWFSAGGGIAVFFISFSMFHYFNIKEDVCKSKQTIENQGKQIVQLTKSVTDLQKEISALHASGKERAEDYERLKTAATSFEAELSGLKKGLQKIVIVATAARAVPIMIEYMSPSGRKQAHQIENSFEIDTDDLYKPDPGIFVTYDTSKSPAEWERRRDLPPIIIERLEHSIHPLRIALFLNIPRLSGSTP